MHLYTGSADNLEPYADQRFDTIIINSVIFFFYDTEYLLKVVRECCDMLEDGGALFIGDVIDNDMKEVFQTSIEVYGKDRPDAEKTAANVRERISKIKDLLVSKSFFRDVTASVPGFNLVRIEDKNSRFKNELTEFRYDVTLYKNVAACESSGEKGKSVNIESANAGSENVKAESSRLGRCRRSAE